MSLLPLALCSAQAANAAQVDNLARNNFTSDSTVSHANPPPRSVIVDEGFDDITTLPGSGWTLFNNSDGIGLTGWSQGSDVVFNAFDGVPTAYISANYNNTDGGKGGGSGVISNWLVSPPINFASGATVSFYTRTSTDSIYPDRMQVRLCTTMPCADFGAAGEGTGDFATLLTDINAAESAGGYPDDWAQYTLTNTDGLPASGTGRVAFRYYIHNAGPSGTSSNYIGIDRVNIEEGTPNGGGDPVETARALPSLGTSAMIGLGALLALFGFVGMHRRRMS